MRRLASVAAGLVCVALACGGRVGGGGDAGTDSASDTVVTPWTDCSAPSGAKVCGGPKACSPECKQCFSKYGTFPNPDPDVVNVCLDVGMTSGVNGKCEAVCSDGGLCIADGYLDDFAAGGCWNEDMAVLFARNGAARRVRYADFSAYTGDPLPRPQTCPSIPGLPLCSGDDYQAKNGACPSCVGSKYRCAGRSPAHPYSLCVNWMPGGDVLAVGCTRSVPDCNVGHACFIMRTADAASQSIADRHGLCIDESACRAAAESYPGGAFCLP